VEEHQLLPTLARMLHEDADPHVVANCLHVLRQARAEASLPALPAKTTVYRLLNMLKEFSEWGQCEVLDYIGSYR
jgi:vesicle coat complex subunit